MVNDEEGVALYYRLLAGDRVASHRLCELYLGPLTTYLRRRHRVDHEHAHDAAVDALLALIHRPTTYQPEKSGLFAYLVMSAEGDLRNRLKKERREQARLSHVDPAVLQRNTSVNGHDDLDDSGSILSSSLSFLWPRLVRLFPNPCERAVLDLLAQGERRTAAYAQVLGVAHLPPEAQQRAVKRPKDRVKKRLRRLGETLRAQTPT